MTTAARETIIGDPVDRVDGPLKVTGAALYPSDFTYPDLTHAVLVQSTIAAGTIRGIDAAKAEAAPGVLAVITHENAPALVEGPMTPLGPSPPFPLKDNRILHQGQHVAVVVARTREHARAAAQLVRIDYEQAAPDPLAEAAPGILAHMNADHVDAMILLAGSHAGIEATEATMTSADRLGFSLKLKTNDEFKGARINFLHEVATPQDTRAVLVEMVRRAKARG